jgi:RNA polymerase sigma factor (sigma-70 family)
LGSFETTRWSLVAASSGESAAARGALEALCTAYRAPMLAFVRRHGYARGEAEDLVQSFFLALIEHRYQAAADPERGRFRSFLIMALKRFLAKAQDRDHAAKRGGGVAAVSLDEAPEAATGEESPEAAFDRCFALTVLERALGRLEQEARDAGKAVLYERVKGYIADAADAKDYEEIAAELGMRANTVAVAVYRLRQRLRDLVRAELADTVSDPAQVDAELEALRGALGASLS